MSYFSKVHGKHFLIATEGDVDEGDTNANAIASGGSGNGDTNANSIANGGSGNANSISNGDSGNANSISNGDHGGYETTTSKWKPKSSKWRHKRH